MSIISGGAIFESSGLSIFLSTTSAYQNVPASITVMAVGGVPPYTYSIVSGSLPTGLSLNSSTGIISGTPTGSGVSSFTLHVTDSNSNTLSLSTSITVYILTGTGPCSAAICITTGSVNELATLQLQTLGYFSDGSAVNLTSLAAYACTGGSGCTGSTISSSGLFTAGSTAGSATVQASFNSVNGTGAVTVMGTNPTITYPTSTLPNGQQYQPYSEGILGDPQGQGVQILATGGVAPYTCSISTGSLPTGLSLSNVAGNTNCLIGGAPTTSGAGSSFVIKVTDSSSNFSTVTISSGITIVSLTSLIVNLAQTSIAANTTTTASALGIYSSDSSSSILPNAASAGASFVQKQSGVSSASVTSFALPAMSTTTGNMLVVFQQTGAGGSTCPSYSVPTDTAGNTYHAATTQIGGPASPPPFYNCGQLFYAYNITGNAANVTTCNIGTSQLLACVVLEYTGIPTTDPLDQHPAPTQATPVSTCTPNSVTTAQNNELGIIVCLPNSATGYTLPSGYISRDTTNWSFADQTYTSTTTTTPVTSFSGGATSEDSFIATFKSNTPTAGGVVWSSGTPSCATVSSLGVVIGQAVQTNCTSVITATVGAVSNTATITVTASNTDTGIVISPSSASQALGQSIQFIATGNNTGQTYPAAWGSSNTSIATIGSSSGLATCTNTGGTVNISAAVSGFASTNASLTCTQAAIVNWTNVHQVIDGFGATSTNDAGSGTTTLMTSAQAAFFFGTGAGQLGLSIIRVAPPNGVFPTAGSCLSVDTGSSTTCSGSYLSDVLFATSYGARVYSEPQSPPAIYTTNNSVICTANGGGGTLAPAHYADYATWLVNFIKSLQSKGATVVAMNIQGEPNFCSSQSAGITMSSQAIHDFITNNMGPALVSAGLSSVMLLMPDSTNYANIVIGNTCGTDAACMNFVGGAAWDDYDAHVTSLATDVVNSTPYPASWISSGKHYWQGEVSCQSGGGGPNWCNATSDPSITNALYWAAAIDHRFAIDNVNAWMYFWFMLPQSVNSGEALLYTGNPDQPALRAYVMGQYSKFIRPGYFRIDATHNPQTGISLSAYQNTTGGNLAIVATNYTSSSVSQAISIINAPSFSTLTPYITSGISGQTIQAQAPISVSGNTFSYTLPAQSITTFVGVAGSSGGVINEPDCSSTTWNGIQSQINNLSGAVTINFPNCNAIWTEAVGITVPAAITSLTIQGQTVVTCSGGAPGTANYVCTSVDNTVITDNYNNTNLTLSIAVGSSAFRMTGITYQVSSSNPAVKNDTIQISGNSSNARIDHNNFQTTSTLNQFMIWRGILYGVIDHNIVNGVRGTTFAAYNYGDTFGDTNWTLPLNLGTSQFMFVENNYLTGNALTDCYGGRFVARYNTIINPWSVTSPLTSHQTGGGDHRGRGCRASESYNNYAAFTNGQTTPTFLNSIPGVHWGNTAGVGFNSTAGGNIVRQDGTSTHTNPIPSASWGNCGNPPPGVQASNGPSPWDGNNDNTGWPCLDQPGRGMGDLISGPTGGPIVNSTISCTPSGLAGSTCNAWPHQLLEPVYYFMNTKLGAGTNNFVNFAGTALAANRDYYFDCNPQNPSCSGTFNGTAGTGFGLLSARPTSCTAGPGGTFGTSPTGSYGVGYFATDTNTLYVCTTSGNPGTWTAVYTPFQYPHPLNH